MFITVEAKQRKWREDILLAGDFNAYFYNQKLRRGTDLLMILQELQHVITAGYRADINPLHDLRHCFPAFTWTNFKAPEIEAQGGIACVAETEDYLFLKDYDQSWRDGGIIGARSKETPLPQLICHVQNSFDHWEPLLQHEWVTVSTHTPSR